MCNVTDHICTGRCRGKKVAVKVPVNQHLTPEEMNDFRKEVQIMSKIFHPNVVLFMGACTQAGNIKIVTELMDMDLEHFLKTEEGRTLSLFQRMKMAKDAALGMNWLHGITRIIHRDFKTANLLVSFDENLRVKVIDFGFSEIKPSMTGQYLKDQFGPRGTALWMAPEVMQGKEFDETIDVYAFGIVLWEIVMLLEPFAHHDDWDVFFDAVVLKGERPPLDAATFCKMNKETGSSSSTTAKKSNALAHKIVHVNTMSNPLITELPASLASLIRDCWSPMPRQRPSFNQIVYRIDEVLVDTAIEDPQGRAFWREMFLLPRKELQERVNWDEFVQALMRKTRLQTKQRFDHLYHLLVDANNEATIHKFNHMVSWFGHFFVAERANHVLDEIRDVVERPWFHGEIDITLAESVLQDKPAGTYLVRLSTTYAQYPFTLSLSGKQHKRIKKEVVQGQIVFSIVLPDKKTVRRASSLIELLDAVAKPFNLLTPCPKDEMITNPYE